MKRSVLGIVIALLAVGAIAAAVLFNRKDNSDSTTAQPTSPALVSPTPPSSSEGQAEGNQSQQIVIENFAFSPAKLTVKKGTTVTWTNQDTVKHDVMPDTKVDFFKPSELLAKGESYSFTFDTAGTYTYHCSPHPTMKGTIEVTE